tara:strand:+ start:2519 stop:2803 length:285 start_codon:yes stop_codon:yes gene_type:complete
MKTFISLLVLFFSFPLLSLEWNFEYLKELNDGCLGTAVDIVSVGKAFEYCGCTTHNLAEEFTISEIIEIYSLGDLSSNKKYNTIVTECNNKIGY